MCLLLLRHSSLVFLKRLGSNFCLFFSLICLFLRSHLSLLQSLGCVAGISSHSSLITPLLNFLLLLDVRRGSLLGFGLFVRLLLHLFLLSLFLTARATLTLLGLKRSPRSLPRPELFHQLFATLALPLLVTGSLDCPLSSKPFECGLCLAALEVIAQHHYHLLGLLAYRLVDDGSKLSQTRRRVPARR